MHALNLEIPGAFIIEPDVFMDRRGFFMETWNQKRFESHNLPAHFVQDNLSFSSRGVIRGLHFQFPHGQGKLISVLQGEILDIIVDIAVGSPSFGRKIDVVLSEKNKHQLYVPEGCAHGFCVISQTALVAYKCTAFYNKETERGIRWNDPDLDISWPENRPILSEKDSSLPFLKDIPKNFLPHWSQTAICGS